MLKVREYIEPRKKAESQRIYRAKKKLSKMLILETEEVEDTLLMI